MVARHQFFGSWSPLAVVAFLGCTAADESPEAVARLEASILRAHDRLDAMNAEVVQLEARIAESEAAVDFPAVTKRTTRTAPSIPQLARLPIQTTPDARVRIAVALTEEGIEVDGNTIELGALRERFERAATASNTTVVVQATRDVDQARIVEVMDAAKTAGITQLGLAKPATP